MGEGPVVNSYVKTLLDTIDEAASQVHNTHVRLRPPKKVPTPYGGKLIWTLPGKTKIVTHLKDKQKIRHKKRWSQASFCYYLINISGTTQKVCKHQISQLQATCLGFKSRRLHRTIARNSNYYSILFLRYKIFSFLSVKPRLRF